MRAAVFAFFASIAILISAGSAKAAPLDDAYLTPASAGSSPAAQAERLIGGILSFARWPEAHASPSRTLCVVGKPRFSGQITSSISSAGRPARGVAATAADVMGGRSCDAVFLGMMPVADRRALIQWVRARPVLTITDDDPSCAYGAMFCLQHKGAAIGFSVNIDAVSRSRVRVDPRVLRIGSEGAT